MATLCGCGGKKEAADSDNSPPAIKRVDLADLPALGDAIKDAEDNLVEISPPANWYVYPEETSKYVSKFSLFKRGESPLPLIVVTVEDSPFAELETVTEESLEDFAIAMAELKKERGEKLLERVRPMVIGNLPCIRYVKKVRLKFRQPKMQTISGEQQVIQTLAHSKIYTIDLRIREETITKFRDHAYAVAASMRFK